MCVLMNSYVCAQCKCAGALGTVYLCAVSYTTVYHLCIMCTHLFPLCCPVHLCVRTRHLSPHLHSCNTHCVLLRTSVSHATCPPIYTHVTPTVYSCVHLCLMPLVPHLHLRFFAHLPYQSVGCCCLTLA